MLSKKQKRRIEKEVKALLYGEKAKPKKKEISRKDIYACFNADCHKRIYHRPGKYDARFQV